MRFLTMTGLRTFRSTLLVLVLPVLAACGSNPYTPPPPVEPDAPARPRPSESRPDTVPSVPRVPSVQKAHPRYAPPPQGRAHWDNNLGVYVLEGEVYYRERLYYRWSDGWYCSGRLDGPWESVDMPSVPTGLRDRH
ncbi:hypothetical protein HW090_15655 [Pseudomonas sp. ABC1]|uniref:hypothetical protein n=1 Tax=Pseudomonas sp. ABC1 TaxID=2748080 RepID=UPI0015C2D2C7|nr:hypothetical protein [Pseudomonas sp. ABC1]QLF94555.1 hypothetical protein HW090_15655 [Pseudomonas sp. ABC1]